MFTSAYFIMAGYWWNMIKSGLAVAPRLTAKTKKLHVLTLDDWKYSVGHFIEFKYYDLFSEDALKNIYLQKSEMW